MRFTRSIIFGVLGAFLFCSVVRAENIPSSGSPYSAIVSRNIFGLIPIPTAPPVDPTPAIPPPKITPNGIMNIFGKLQALFKAAVPAKEGQPAHDESYVLTEGEQQDEIEVTKIDEKGGVITFNNHGVVQALPLVNGVASSGATGSAPSPSGFGAPTQPGLPVNNFGNRFGRNPNLPGNVPNTISTPNASISPSEGGLPNFGSAGAGDNNGGSQPEENLSPEAQVLMIEKNRLDTQDEVTRGRMPPLPPTVLTPPEATGGGGLPLISTPEAPPVP